MQTLVRKLALVSDHRDPRHPGCPACVIIESMTSGGLPVLAAVWPEHAVFEGVISVETDQNGSVTR